MAAPEWRKSLAQDGTPGGVVNRRESRMDNSVVTRAKKLPGEMLNAKC